MDNSVKKFTFKEFYLKNRLYFHCFIFFCLLIINCFYSQVAYISLSLLMILILIDSLKCGFSYIICYIPFCLLGGDIGIILYFCCILVYIIKAYAVIIFKDKTKPNFVLLILSIILILYSLIHFQNVNITTFLNIAIFIFIILGLNLYVRKKEIFNFHYNIKLLCVSIIIASILSCLYFVSPYLQSFITPFYLTTNLVRFSALFTHPNTLAILCEIALSILTFFLITEKKSIFNIVLFCLITLIGLLTFSKTFILLLLVILIAIFIKGLKINKKITLITTGIILLCTIIFCIVANDVVNIVIERFFGRITECNSFRDFMNMITTDRFDLWVEYLKEIFYHPTIFFFGKGLGCLPIQILGAHNTFISLFYQLGIVGLVLLGFTIGYLIKQILKIEKFNNAMLVPVIVILLLLMVEDMILFS